MKKIPKLTFNDLKYGRDIIKKFNLSIQQGEHIVRNHYYGANSKEIREGYEDFFKKRNDE